MKYRLYAVNTISASLVIQLFEFGDEFNKCFVGLAKVTCGNLVLVDNSDSVDELAIIFPIYFGKDIVE
jgi:hypothetical protein